MSVSGIKWLSNLHIYIYILFWGVGWVGFPGGSDAWRIPWTEEAWWWAMVMRSQRVRHDWATNTFTHHFHTYSFFTFSSLINYYKILSIVICFIYQSVYFNPKLLGMKEETCLLQEGNCSKTSEKTISSNCMQSAPLYSLNSPGGPSWIYFSLFLKL